MNEKTIFFFSFIYIHTNLRFTGEKSHSAYDHFRYFGRLLSARRNWPSLMADHRRVAADVPGNFTDRSSEIRFKIGNGSRFVHINLRLDVCLYKKKSRPRRPNIVATKWNLTVIEFLLKPLSLESCGGLLRPVVVLNFIWAHMNIVF